MSQSRLFNAMCLCCGHMCILSGGELMMCNQFCVQTLGIKRLAKGLNSLVLAISRYNAAELPARYKLMCLCHVSSESTHVCLLARNLAPIRLPNNRLGSKEPFPMCTMFRSHKIGWQESTKLPSFSLGRLSIRSSRKGCRFLTNFGTKICGTNAPLKVRAANL